jgi:hypothetical protein
MYQYNEYTLFDIIRFREMNQKFKDVLDLKQHIKNDGVKDGIPLTTLAWGLYKAANKKLLK